MGRKSSGRKLKKGVIAVLVALVLVIVGIILVSSFVGELRGSGKKEQTAEITVYDIDSIEDIAHKLQQSNIIKYEWLFNLYANTKPLSRGFVTGTLTFHIGDSYASIIDTVLKPKVVIKPKETLTIRFKEGCEVRDVVALFIKNGIGDETSFEQTILFHDFGYSYIPDVGTPNRLEGFLFPDTYEFYADSTPEEALQKMVDTFNKKVWNSAVMKEAIQSSGRSLYDILKMASLVEKEAGSQSDMPMIASVFYNRLNIGVLNEDGKTRRKILESDATYQYLLPPSERKVNLTSAQINDKTNKYNTYQYAGLMPTPICNPSLAAIKAAASPATSDYVYFYAKKSGVTVFAKTFAEHKRNIASDQ